MGARPRSKGKANDLVKENQVGIGPSDGIIKGSRGKLLDILIADMHTENDSKER